MAITSRNRTIIIVVIAIVVLVAIITPIVYFTSKDAGNGGGGGGGGEGESAGSQGGQSEGLVDCLPEKTSALVTPTQEMCEQRGCVYDKKAIVDGRGFTCYYPTTGGLQYSVEKEEVTEKGKKIYLKRSGWGPFGMDFRSPSLDVQMLSNHLLRLTFDDDFAYPPRYRVPIETTLPTEPANSSLYEFSITDKSRFSFQVKRKSTGKVIFDTSPGGLVLSDQFLQIVTRLPSDRIYGMGENTHSRFKHEFGLAWPAFSRDQPPGGHDNLYGVHPFYTCTEDNTGNTHGVFILNSNAQEYALDKDPYRFTFRTIGGILDIYIFLGPTPENVVQQYTGMIGRPYMPPYWALGFQLCRYGYNNLENLKRAVEETLRYDVPLDVQYADIDHMDERKIFTVDKVNFAGLDGYFKDLRSKGMHTIIILDPCIISNETDYEPYEVMKGCNVKWPEEIEPPNGSAAGDRSMLGFVWPKGKVVFPDFFQSKTRQQWSSLIVQHHQNISFDGLWIDMNEPANFGTNEERPWNWPQNYTPYWSLHCGNNTWDEPPYRPLAAYHYDNEDQNIMAKISQKTLCMVGLQGEQGEYKHYDVHSLYGWSQTQATLEALRNATKKRGLVISRSTYPSSGKYSGHWLGDNTSLWKHLADSIIGILEFNLFGIPYIGADICGFFGNTTEELCLRWMQLGAFYTYSRNHNGIDYIEQHPGRWETVANASREILQTRYWLLPYLYTLFHHAHVNGDTVIRPLHHEFMTDERTYSIDRQFLWGPALLISPILEENATSLTYYLPTGRWYHFYSDEITTGPSDQTVPVSLMSKPELHLRGGHILVMQHPANNTVYSRKNPFTIKVLLDGEDTQGGQAEGTLFWDDGDSVDTYENGTYFQANYLAANRQMTITVTHEHPELTVMDGTEYETIIIHGVTAASTVTVTDTDTSSTIPTQIGFNLDVQKLIITPNTTMRLSNNYTITWS